MQATGHFVFGKISELNILLRNFKSCQSTLELTNLRSKDFFISRWIHHCPVITGRISLNGFFPNQMAPKILYLP